MKTVLHILGIIFILVIGGCSSKDALIEMRTQLSSPEVIEDNIVTINEILAQKSTDPFYFSEAMKTGMVLSRNGNLSATSNTQYSSLIDNFISIRENDRIEASLFGSDLDLDKYNEYMKVYSIYCLSNSKGDRLPEEIINVLYTLNQYDDEKAIVSTLDGLLQHIEVINSNELYKARTLVGLARFRDGMNLTGDEKSLLASIENELVDLQTLNYIYKKDGKYLKTTAQYNYIFTLNQSIYQNLLDEKMHVDSYVNLKENIQILMKISENTDIDQVYRDKVDTILLKYIPLAYYTLIYKQKETTYALSKLISLYEYMLREDEAASQSDKIYFYSSNEIKDKHRYLNHTQIFSKEVFKKVDKIMKNYFFTAMDTMLVNESYEYHSFYYSFMIDLFPHKFIEFVLKDYKKNKDYPDLNNRISHAMKLINSNDIALSKKEKEKILEASLYIYKVKSPHFTPKVYTAFQKDVVVYLARDKNAAYLKTSTDLLMQNKKIVSIEEFTHNFLYALSLKKRDNKTYTNAFKKIFAFQNEIASKYLSNYLMAVDVNFLQGMYASSVMNEKIKLWEVSMIGSVCVKNTAKTKAAIKSSINKKFVSLIQNKDDDISLLSARYAKELGASGKTKVVENNLNKRFSGLKL